MAGKLAALLPAGKQTALAAWLVSHYEIPEYLPLTGNDIAAAAHGKSNGTF